MYARRGSTMPLKEIVVFPAEKTKEATVLEHPNAGHCLLSLFNMFVIYTQNAASIVAFNINYPEAGLNICAPLSNALSFSINTPWSDWKSSADFPSVLLPERIFVVYYFLPKAVSQMGPSLLRGFSRQSKEPAFRFHML